jgi:hypothetical protein
LCILPWRKVGLFNCSRDQFLAGLAGMNVARELVLRRCIQQSDIACAPASGSSGRLKGSENVGNNALAPS